VSIRKGRTLPASCICSRATSAITLTFPTIASSRAVALLVAGAEKYPIIARVRRGDPALPAA